MSSIGEHIIKILRLNGSWMTVREVNIKRLGRLTVTRLELHRLLRDKRISERVKAGISQYRLRKTNE